MYRQPPSAEASRLEMNSDSSCRSLSRPTKVVLSQQLEKSWRALVYGLGRVVVEAVKGVRGVEGVRGVLGVDVS